MVSAILLGDELGSGLDELGTRDSVGAHERGTVGGDDPGDCEESSGEDVIESEVEVSSCDESDETSLGDTGGGDDESGGGDEEEVEALEDSGSIMGGIGGK